MYSIRVYLSSLSASLVAQNSANVSDDGRISTTLMSEDAGEKSGSSVSYVSSEDVRYASAAWCWSCSCWWSCCC